MELAMRLVQSERFVERKPVRKEAVADLAAVWSSAQWVTYFVCNGAKRLNVPWSSGPGVSPEELSRIADSLRGWQLGETSDGSHLLAAAANYAAKLDDPGFLDA